MDISRPSSDLPLARLALAVAVPVPKEVLAVEAGDLLSVLNVPEHLHARRVAARGHKLRELRSKT